MCGIAGTFSSQSTNLQEAQIRKMAASLSHRGPDAEGFYCKDRLALAHRRLSILDLSDAGKQPMMSISGRYHISFNGEIYNFLSLKKQLPTTQWRGGSDTEVLLAAIEYFGLAVCLEKIVGMFAFALWDNKEQTITLVRDRLGEKPLYYTLQNNTLYFASELKALSSLSDSLTLRENQTAIGWYVRLGYIPAPLSIYQDVFKVLPGHSLTISIGEGRVILQEQKPYWKIQDVVRTIPNIKASSYEDSKKEITALLKRAVTNQMLSDVSIGAFLSGGIDSSLITALMQSMSPMPIKTFSIGFAEDTHNEATFARDISQHLGTEHYEYMFGAQDVLNTIPKLCHTYDEPFGDSSSLPSIILAKFARQYVTVVLTGDGADELFGGYSRYLKLNGIISKLQKLDPRLRNMTAALVKSIPNNVVAASSGIADILLNRLGSRPLSYRFEMFLNILNFMKGVTPYTMIHKQWHDDVLRERCALDSTQQFPSTHGNMERMMLEDLVSYLPDDILVKVDRATMSSSLESRAPFLDRDVVEAAVNLPLEYKVRDMESKYILKDILADYVPRDLFMRPKQGFSVPLDAWFRKELKEWVHDLLSYDRLQKQGIFNPMVVQKKLHEHMQGTYNWKDALWIILNFQSWITTKSSLHQ